MTSTEVAELIEKVTKEREDRKAEKQSAKALREETPKARERALNEPFSLDWDPELLRKEDMIKVLESRGCKGWKKSYKRSVLLEILEQSNVDLLLKEQ